MAQHEAQNQSTLSQDPLFQQFLNEHYQGGGQAPVPNPKHQYQDGRKVQKEVTFSTALKNDIFRQRVTAEFQRWRETQKQQSRPKPPGAPETAPPRRAPKPEQAPQPEAPPKQEAPHEAPRQEHPEWAAKQNALLEFARRGEVVRDEPLDDSSTANIVRKRRLKVGDKEHNFVWKPVTGEAASARIGIEQGSYHQREAASYNIDRLLGEGTVVPPTITNGEGSYQQFIEGARSLMDVYDTPSIPAEDLVDHPDFQRICALDAILGHEDRHDGNVMFVPDSRSPNGVRFIAIDNGFSLASPRDKIGNLAYYVKDAWTGMYWQNEEDKKTAGKAITRATQKIDPELHSQIRDVDHERFVQELAGTGLTDKYALLAALVRLSAIQRDSRIIGSFEGEHHPVRYLGSQQKFQWMSGKEPQKLLDMAGEGPSVDELRKVVDKVLKEKASKQASRVVTAWLQTLLR